MALMGRMEEAKVALQDFVKVQPGITISRYQRNAASDDPVAINTYKRMMDGLRKAGLPE